MGDGDVNAGSGMAPGATVIPEDDAPPQNGGEAPAPQPEPEPQAADAQIVPARATARDVILSRVAAHKRKTRKVYLKELDIWMEVRGMQFGDHLRAQAAATKMVDPKKNIKEINDGESQTRLLMSVVVDPPLLPTDLEAIQGLPMGDLGDLSEAIGELSGLETAEKRQKVLNPALFTQKPKND